jgi:Transposase DDE domain
MQSVQTFFDRCAEKFPLALSTRLLLERTLHPDVLNEFYEVTAREQYTKTALFSDLVALMSSVVHRMHRSVHAAYHKSALARKIKLSALYDKLNGIEPHVSSAFVADHAERIGKVIDDLEALRPPLVPGYTTRIIDGNAIGASEHRLEVLRDIRSGPLPGKTLAIFDYERDITSEIIMCEDGHAQERSLSDDILARVKPNDLWIADRNFCTAKLLVGMVQRGAAVLIREHRNIPIQEENPLAVVARKGKSVLREGTVTLTYDGQTILLRRIWLTLPKGTRDGDKEIVVLTNLPPDVASAEEVMEHYLRRWTIESMFADLTVSLRCEVKALGHPRAALFVFAMAVVSANTLAGVRAGFRAAHGADVEEGVSVYQLVDDLQGSYRITEALDDTSEATLAMSSREFLAVFLSLVQRVDLRRYPKAKTRPRSAPRVRGSATDPPHVSTYRLLQERNARARARS